MPPLMRLSSYPHETLLCSPLLAHKDAYAGGHGTAFLSVIACSWYSHRMPYDDLEGNRVTFTAFIGFAKTSMRFLVESVVVASIATIFDCTARNMLLGGLL